MKVVEIVTVLMTAANAKLAAAQEEVTALGSLQAAHDVEVKEAHDAGYDEGVLKSGEVKTDDKIFSLEEMNAEINPLKERITAMETSVSELQAKNVELQAQVDGSAEALVAAKESGKEELKAELLSDYDARQVVESETETGYREKLLPKA